MMDFALFVMRGADELSVMIGETKTPREID